MVFSVSKCVSLCVCVSGFCDNTRRGLYVGIHIKEEGGGEKDERKSDEGGEEIENVEKNKTKRQMWRK